MSDIWIVIIVSILIGYFATLAAYRNGVCDGAGAIKESWNPGYQKALRILHRSMSHIWNDIPPLPSEWNHNIKN